MSEPEILHKWKNTFTLPESCIDREFDYGTDGKEFWDNYRGRGWETTGMGVEVVANELARLARRVQRLEQAFDNLPTFLRSARDDVWKSPQCETRRMALRTLDQAMDYLSEKKAALAEEAE